LPRSSTPVAHRDRSKRTRAERQALCGGIVATPCPAPLACDRAAVGGRGRAASIGAVRRVAGSICGRLRGAIALAAQAASPVTSTKMPTAGDACAGIPLTSGLLATVVAVPFVPFADRSAAKSRPGLPPQQCSVNAVGAAGWPPPPQRHHSCGPKRKTAAACGKHPLRVVPRSLPAAGVASSVAAMAAAAAAARYAEVDRILSSVPYPVRSAARTIDRVFWAVARTAGAASLTALCPVSQLLCHAECRARASGRVPAVGADGAPGAQARDVQ
jgi:hypothetical protein